MYIILDIALICVVLLFAFFGAKKGFVRTFIELLGYVLAVIIAFTAANYTAEYVYENSIRETVVSSVSSIANDSVESSVNTAETTVDKIWDSIPSFITVFSSVEKDDISDYLAEYQNSKDEQIEEIAVAVSDNVIKPIALSAIQLVVSIVSIAILFFLVKVSAKFIGGIFNKSVFKGLNKFLGIISGGIKGLIVAVLAVTLIKIILPLFDNNLYFITPELIEKTYLFKMFYNIGSLI